MQLDPLSIALALVLSVFGFLVFLLWNKKYELNMVEKRVAPAAKESLDVLIKNFLSFGDIPTKSKLISIMTSVARKHQVQLLTHLPIQNIIDNLVYHVVSNDLLDPYKKKEISDNLIKLKTEPINSEDYVQMLTDNEESASWKQKLAYSQLTKVLISSSVFIVVFGIIATQFRDALGGQAAYIVDWLLCASIGFSVLVACFTFLTVSSILSGNKSNGPENQEHRLSSSKHSGSLPTRTSSRSRYPQADKKDGMMSIHSINNLNNKERANAKQPPAAQEMDEYEEEPLENKASFETI
jgi:hypothetical protein